MPTITINGTPCEFEQGETILQVANRRRMEIPYYCYHDGLSIVAQCRICLVEVWAPNPRNENRLEPIPKLLPACQTTAGDGQLVYSDSPKAVANQKAVMEYLLINHPLDCPVCDQSGECFLQDYSFKFGRGVSRYEEEKVKQPKKDLGPHVYLYADRCIMCTRCTRFAREVAGTSELIIEDRGNKVQIDVFPGRPLDNELSGNVVDLCPVGALLDKDFLFTQRVWWLKTTPSVDPITSSGDNINIEHNEGVVYRVKPRVNLEVNKWWITDEVRYGWKFVHSDARILTPRRRSKGATVECALRRAYDDALGGMRKAVAGGGRLMAVISPMLACEEAYLLCALALAVDADALVAIGAVPVDGEDRTFPPGADEANAFIMRAEKAPNARGVRRVIKAVTGRAALEFDEAVAKLESGAARAALVTGNYPSEWVTDRLREALAREDVFVTLVDTLESEACAAADVVIPSATWAEKAGTFENVKHRLQAFEQAITPIGQARAEGQIALDLLDLVERAEEGAGLARSVYNAANVRQAMANAHEEALGVFVTDVHMPRAEIEQQPDMEVVEL